MKINILKKVILTSILLVMGMMTALAVHCAPGDVACEIDEELPLDTNVWVLIVLLLIFSFYYFRNRVSTSFT